MRDLFLSMLPVAFCFAIVRQKKVVVDINEEKPWGLSQGKMLQAIACLGVILHHLAQVTTSYGTNFRGLLTIYDSMGILFTSIFFFFSGYGLVTSYLSKSNYLDGFLWHRLSAVFVPFGVTNSIYILYRIFVRHLPMSAGSIVSCIFGVRLINDHSWYIVEIILLYLIFYCIFSLIPKKDIAIVLYLVAIVGMIYYGSTKGHDTEAAFARWFYGEWWYNTTITFALGVIVARFREPIITFFVKHYRKCLVAFLILFFISYYLEEQIRMRFGYYNESPVINRISNTQITLNAQMILCICFICMVLLINMKVHFHNAILSGIGKISLELYLIHGLFIHMFFELNIDEVATCILVIGCSIIVAILIHFVDKKLQKAVLFLEKKKNSLVHFCKKMK